MAEVISSFSFYMSGSSSPWAVSEVLLVTLLSVILIWYAQFHWNRRRLYEIANQLHGPPSLPIIGSALLFLGSPSYIYENIMKIFDKYPGVSRIWFGHRLFYGVANPEDLEILLNNPKALHKDSLYRYAKIVGGNGLFSAPLSIWKRHRKVIAPTFNQRILDSFVEVFGEQSTILVEQLKKVAGRGEFDVFHYVTNSTVDIFCETALGTKGTAQTSGSTIAKYTDKALEIMFLRMFCILYHCDTIFKMTRHYKEEKEAVDFIHNFTRKIVREKRISYEARMQNLEINTETHSNGVKWRKAFLDFLIELSYDGAKFTDEELREEVDTFMIAGTDTTATTNCFVFLTLGIHQDIQQRVYEEIMDVLGPNRVVEASDLPHLQYTERVIKETLRLFPVGPVIVRAVEDDIQLTSCVVPGSASVVVGIQHMHKNPKYWPDPEKFDPDRFLPQEVAKRHPYVYIPFSAGPRNCIGLKYAMMAMKSLIATVIRKYEIHCGYRSINEVKLKTNLILRPCDGFKLSIQSRN